MIVTIASPDKLSIAMFLSFLLKNLGQGFSVGEMHSLMSENSIDLYVDSMKNINSKLIFTYYAKKKKTPDSVPKKLIMDSDAVVWFNMYETKYEILKDVMNFDALFKDTWMKNLKALGGG